MNNDDFISTAEAADMIGVSGKTVIRRSMSHLKENSLTLEQATDLIELRRVSGKNKYFVSKAFVLRHLLQDGSTVQKHKANQGGYATRQLLRQLEIKDQQLDKKDDQIAAKDRQIGDLSERLRESHVLLKTEQELHLEVRKSKRPLISLSRDASLREKQGSVGDEGSRPFRRVVSGAALGFTIISVVASVVYAFL